MYRVLTQNHSGTIRWPKQGTRMKMQYRVAGVVLRKSFNAVLVMTSSVVHP